MEIRRAEPVDLPLLQRIEVEAGKRFLEVDMPEIAEDDPPSIEDLEGAEHLLVAVVDGQVVGYGRGELVGGHGHLEQLSVLPTHEGRGVGGALIDCIAAWAAERGDAELTLTTFADVPFNAPYYRRRGFTDVTDLNPALAALVAEEAAHGLDPATRVVMRRPT